MAPSQSVRLISVARNHAQCTRSLTHSLDRSIDRWWSRYDIPCVAFINKMDREGASLDATLQSMSSKLYITDHSLESSINNAKPVRPLLLQLPLNGAKNAFVYVFGALRRSSTRPSLVRFKLMMDSFVSVRV